MVSLKTLGIIGGIGFIGVIGYAYFAPNTGFYWLGKIGARSKEEVEGYFNGVIRGIKVAGGDKSIFDKYLNEWKAYWISQNPDAISTVNYWADWAEKQWNKIQ